MKFKFKYAFVIVLSMVILSCGDDDGSPAGEPDSGTDFEGNATAEYTLSFETSFSEEMFPEEYPSNPSFGPVVAIIHSPNINVFQTGSVANDGLAAYAESGDVDALVTALESQQGQSEGLFLIQTASNASAVGTSSFDITFTPTRTRVTFLAKLNPSPDWFVGAASLDIVDGNTLKEEIQTGLVLLDAGTKAGETYESSSVSENNTIGICVDAPYAGDGPFVESLGNLTIARN